MDKNQSQSRIPIMQRAQPLIALMRLNKPIGIWLTFFPASWAVLLATCSDSSTPWPMLYVMLIGAALTRSAGCIMNDLADRHLDGKVARTANRPLASGAVSVRSALILLFILLLMSLLLALMLPRTVLYIAFAAVPMMALYPLMKRITWWPQAFLGITFNLSALIGWASVTDSLSPAAWWLYLGAVCWTFGYDTIYAHQDREDDARIGIKSSARALAHHTPLGVTIAYAIASACFIAAGLSAHASNPYFFGVAAMAIHFAWQISRLNINDAACCGNLFRSNAHAGLLLLLGAVIA